MEEMCGLRKIGKTKQCCLERPLNLNSNCTLSYLKCLYQSVIFLTQPPSCAPVTSPILSFFSLYLPHSSYLTGGINCFLPSLSPPILFNGCQSYRCFVALKLCGLMTIYRTVVGTDWSVMRVRKRWMKIKMTEHVNVIHTHAHTHTVMVAGLPCSAVVWCHGHKHFDR